jgi:dolichol kinase
MGGAAMSTTFIHSTGHTVAMTPVMPRTDSMCSVCGHRPTGVTCVQVRNASGGGAFAVFCRSCIVGLAAEVEKQPEEPATKPDRVVHL